MRHDRDTAIANATVYVVDDDEAVRNSLSWLISSIGLEVKTFSSAQEFLDGFSPDTPGCLIVDVRMPGMNGLELQRRLVDRAKCLPVIVITGHGDVQMAVRAMKDGAFDFIEKPFNDQALIDRIQKAVEECGGRRERELRVDEVRKMAETLTRRERQVMDMITSGDTNKSIAAKLAISGKTVEAHRSKVMEKMQAASLAELVQKTVILDRAD